MPLAISTNIAAEKANYYLGYNADKVQESIKRLASGRRLTSPVQDPGNLAVSMKLSASLNRLAGAMNNAQNGISFLEVQDGMLETVGKIIDRMSELKGLATQDPMKSAMDRYSYNNEFKDLQIQLYSITNEQFNGVSLFSNYTSEGDQEVLFNGMEQSRLRDHTISIHTSQNGSGGAKVSLHKSMLRSALSVKMTLDKAGTDPTNGTWDTIIRRQKEANADADGEVDGNAYSGTINKENSKAWVTLASPSLASTINLDQISVGVFISTLENVSFLRAQNGGAGSRLHFAYENLAQQKTNMRAALGRMIDVDIAQESTNLATYNVLSQAAASMISQANATADLALILLR
jgi:flagellin-like hook-associated protein FlgL